MPKKPGDKNRTVQIQEGEEEMIKEAMEAKGLAGTSFSNLARIAIGRYLGIPLAALKRTTVFGAKRQSRKKGGK